MGFLTVRVGSQPAWMATVSTVILVATWVILTSSWAEREFPGLTGWIPNRYWIGVIPHLFLITMGYGLSWIFPAGKTGLDNLTIWTKVEHSDQQPKSPS